jgi:hypothetical protein
MKKALWTPTYETCISLGIKRGFTPISIEVEIVKEANVITGGTVQHDWSVINYHGVEYVVPNRTLS